MYPTYDYTHCIVDSLENITHSLCTLEFESRQAADGPYYWLLEKLGIYKPVTWEYGRCSITHNVLSKRKLNALVTNKIVRNSPLPPINALVTNKIVRNSLLPPINALVANKIVRNSPLPPINALVANKIVRSSNSSQIALTHSLTHSLTPSFTHSLTLSLHHSLT